MVVVIRLLLIHLLRCVNFLLYREILILVSSVVCLVVGTELVTLLSWLMVRLLVTMTLLKLSRLCRQLLSNYGPV